MNHVYRIVWNHVACTWQAVAESAKGFGKGRQGKSRARLSLQPSPRVSIKPLLAALSLISSSAWAGPQGGQIVAGSATIQQAGNITTINQSTNRAAIDWTSFSVGKAESVRFNQPSTSAITLNRVTGTESSQILGSMSANGQVFILNPNGVLFGKGAQVNVGGLVASTHGMSNADFMDGNYQLSGNGTGAVINQGEITVIEGGTIALIAPIVKNTGTLAANGGSVLLAAADAVSLKLQDGSLIGYTLDKGSLQALVDNGGLIHAEGGHVVLTAKALDALSKATINHSGIIEAQTVANKNGVVELLGDMQVGEIKLSGKIDASAPNGGDGGFVETSAAKVRVLDGYQISTLATGGKTGTWLIDPRDYTIAARGGDITGARLSSYLLSNNVMIQSVTGASDGNGDIYVNDAVNWNAHKLTLSADRNVNINANLTAGGSASLALEYGQSAIASGNTANYFINGAKVNLPAGQNFSTKLGRDGATDVYTVITSLGVAGDTSNTTLQGMENNLTGKYALGGDITATETASWNGGAGWQPIGSSSAFSGVFTGLGHFVRGLYVNRSQQRNVGLFASNSGSIDLVGVEGAKITGGSGAYDGIGGLVGYNTGNVSRSFFNGVLSGDGYSNIGGIVGYGNGGKIVDCYSSGDYTGGNSSGGQATGVGGIVGWNLGLVENTYSTSRVRKAEISGSGFIGGIAGLDQGTINSSYWDTEASGESSSLFGVGKTAAEMKQQATFSGWDFVNTWQIVEGGSYPTLRALASGSGAGPLITAVLDPNLPPYSSAIAFGYKNNTDWSAGSTINWNDLQISNNLPNNPDLVEPLITIGPISFSPSMSTKDFISNNRFAIENAPASTFFNYYFSKELGGEVTADMISRQEQVESDWAIKAEDIFPDSTIKQFSYRAMQVSQYGLHLVLSATDTIQTVYGAIDPVTYKVIAAKSLMASSITNLSKIKNLSTDEVSDLIEISELTIDAASAYDALRGGAKKAAKAQEKLSLLKSKSSYYRYNKILKEAKLEIIGVGADVSRDFVDLVSGI